MDLFNDPHLDTSRYYEYEGSFTTPPCDQGVTWIVIADVCSVPHNFYNYVTSFSSMHKNRRRPQPLGRRKVKIKSRLFSEDWFYPAQNNQWGGLCMEGEEQSPIDFDLEIMTALKPQEDLWHKIHSGTRRWRGQDTGHTLKWTPETKGVGIHYKGYFWEVHQFHIHSKSEHTIAGGQFDIELVLTHRN